MPNITPIHKNIIPKGTPQMSESWLVIHLIVNIGKVGTRTQCKELSIRHQLLFFLSWSTTGTVMIVANNKGALRMLMIFLSSPIWYHSSRSIGFILIRNCSNSSHFRLSSVVASLADIEQGFTNGDDPLFWLCWDWLVVLNSLNRLMPCAGSTSKALFV